MAQEHKWRVWCSLRSMVLLYPSSLTDFSGSVHFCFYSFPYRLSSNASLLHRVWMTFPTVQPIPMNLLRTLLTKAVLSCWKLLVKPDCRGTSSFICRSRALIVWNDFARFSSFLNVFIVMFMATSLWITFNLSFSFSLFSSELEPITILSASISEWPLQPDSKDHYLSSFLRFWDSSAASKLGSTSKYGYLCFGCFQNRLQPSFLRGKLRWTFDITEKLGLRLTLNRGEPSAGP